MKKKWMTRRTFLTTSSLALAAPTILPSSALGKGGAVAPSERLNLAMIGIGGRMNWMLPYWLGSKQAQVVAVCDCWTARREAGHRKANAHYGDNEGGAR